MGGKNTKEEKNEELKQIGRKANEHPIDIDNNTIKLTNDVIVGHLKNKPDEDYKKVKFLGEGSFGAVYQVRNKYSGAICAMKIIKKSSACSREEEEEIRNEINILRTMDHPNILKIFEFYSNPKEYSIITELCSMGELFDQIINKGPFDEKYSAYVLYQVFSAVNYCHKMHILHRDLKPENILIIDKNDDGYPTVKVCDFGTSKIFETGKVERAFVGSSFYMAPEVLNQKYAQLTGIRKPVSEIIEAATTADEKKATYEHLMWHIKNGVIRTGGRTKELVDEFLEMRLDISKRIEELEDYFDENFGNIRMNILEKGIFQLKKLLFYNPDKNNDQEEADLPEFTGLVMDFHLIEKNSLKNQEYAKYLRQINIKGPQESKMRTTMRATMRNKQNLRKTMGNNLRETNMRTKTFKEKEKNLENENAQEDDYLGKNAKKKCHRKNREHRTKRT